MKRLLRLTTRRTAGPSLVLLLLAGCSGVPAGLESEPGTIGEGIRTLAQADTTAIRKLAAAADQARMDTYHLLIVHVALLAAYRNAAIEAAKGRLMDEWDDAAFSLADRGLDLALEHNAAYTNLVAQAARLRGVLEATQAKSAQYPRDHFSPEDPRWAAEQWETVSRQLVQAEDGARADLLHALIAARVAFKASVDRTFAPDYTDASAIPKLPDVPAADASQAADNYIEQLHTFAAALERANYELAAALEYERDWARHGEHFLAGAAATFAGGIDLGSAASLVKDFLPANATAELAKIQADEAALSGTVPSTVQGAISAAAASVLPATASPATPTSTTPATGP